MFRSPLFKVTFCFFLSGTAALLYQTAWMRQLSVVFGTSELAVATVLTAYMFGLSLGAAVAAKFVHRVTKPLLTYGVLEGGIAVSAVLVPLFLTLLGQVSVFFLGGQAEPPEASGFGQLLFYFLSTLLVLVIPTALMGATLPLLTKYAVTNDEQVGSRIGMLYAINTFGAVAGTLFAAFILLPNISLMSTLLVGAAMNLMVLVVVMNIVKTAEQSTDQSLQVKTQKVEEIKSPLLKTPHFWILPIMTVSGIATFIYEVLWTRLVSHILGGSVPAFSIMLASFLVGIALGSAVATRFAKSRDMAKHAFVITQIGIAALSAFTYFMIDSSLPEKGGLFSNAILAFSLILPSTIFIGATFPLAVRIFSKDENDAPAASARVYAWNTVGAIIGATVAGYFLIPAIKYSGSIQFAVYLNLVLAVIVAFFSFNLKTKLYLKVAPFVMLALAVVFYRPETPLNVITFSPIGYKGITGDIVYYDVGRSSTVLLLKEGKGYRLRNNGLPESAVFKEGPALLSKNNALMLSTAPVIARPNAKSMLVAGFGGGVVAENLPPSIEEVDVIELEPKVIEANQAISNVRSHDPLADKRVNVIYNDARSALQLTSKRYDIIVSQPSHPWTAGASHLYTKEYMELVKKHLNDDGVFLQWMNVGFTDLYLLKSLSATLVSTFDNVRVYQFSSGVLFFLASNNTLNIEKTLLETNSDFLDSNYYRSIGYASVESILSSLLMDDAGIREFSQDGRIITDDFNIFGTRSALTVDDSTSLKADQVSNIAIKYSPLYSEDSWVYKELSSKLNFNELVKFIRSHSSQQSLDKFYEVLSITQPNLFSGVRARNLVVNKQIEEAKEQLLSALGSFPNNQQFKYDLLTLYINDNVLADLTEKELFHYETLVPSAKAVLEHWDEIDISSQSYAQLKELDPILANSKHSDSWNINALKMRFFWRVKASRENNQVLLAKEALLLMDEVFINEGIAIIPSWVHELRADAAHMVGNLEVLQNSLNAIILSLNSRVVEYQKPINMINADAKKNTIAQIDRLLSFLSLSSPLEGEIKPYINKFNSLKEQYIKLELAKR